VHLIFVGKNPERIVNNLRDSAEREERKPLEVCAFPGACGKDIMGKFGETHNFKLEKS
jgi:hypothetical protein